MTGLPDVIGLRSTLPTCWVYLLYRSVKEYGLDAEQIFEEAGLNPKRLCHPETRIPHRNVTQIWNKVAERAGDQAFGLTTAKMVFPTMLHSLSMAMYASSTLKSMFEHVIKYCRTIQPLSVMNFQQCHGEYKYVWGSPEPYVSQIATEGLGAAIVAVARQIYGHDFAPLRVSLTCQEPDDTSIYTDFFKAPVEFCADENVMYMNKTMLQQPLLTANPSLEMKCLQMTTDYLARLDRHDTVNLVYSKLLTLLPNHYYSEEIIAESLCLSRRTLQRKLHDAGTSYDSLLQNIRRELALSYVNDDILSIGEISYLSGFSNPGNFIRAFKRWTGRTPGNYRLECSKGPIITKPH